MSRIRSVGLTLIAVVVAGGAASASADAAPLWVVNGSPLKTSETSKATVNYGKLAVTWEDTSTKTKFEAECKKASGEVELEGGEPGKDKQKTLTFEECALLKGGAGCKMKAGGVSAEELPGWPSKLEVKSGKVYDAFTGVRFSLILEGCETARFSKTWLFKGTLKAEAKNSGEKVKLILPTTAVEGDTLESEGAAAVLSGEGELSEKGGGKLAIRDSTCNGGTHFVFCNGEGISLAGELVLGTGGLSRLASTLFGVEVKFHCLSADLHGKLESLGASPGTVVFLGCTVEKPAGCKLSATQESKLEANYTSQQENATLALFTGSGAGEEFIKVDIENKPGETCALTGEFSVTGKQMVELPAGGESLIEQEVVAKKAESFLKLGGNTASFSGIAQIHLGGANRSSAWLVMSGE